MALITSLITLGILSELLIFSTTSLWRYRKVVMYVLAIIVIFSSTALLAARPNLFSGLFFITSLIRLFNLQRVLEARMHEGYLRHATRLTSFVLLGFQALILAIWLGWSQLSNATGDRHIALIVLVISQLLAAIILLASTIRNLIKTRPPVSGTLSNDQLPTLSICIPARNETEDLQACLETLLANDYPKLEILVLDDCSQNRHTPEIIRSFAHDGVQFISGSEPPKHWLAKNWAYQQLLRAASGDYVLFCGVDTRFSPTSLYSLVRTMLVKRKAMLSVVPERLDAHDKAIIQPMRYWWELVPPRWLFRRPPVLSSCWIAKNEALKKAGSFSATTRSVAPEAYFARYFIASDGYSFLRSADQLGVTSVKSFREQRATAIRTRYPQIHRRPELVLLLSLAELAFLVLPFGLAIGGWWLGGLTLPVISLITSILLIASYEALVRATMPLNAPLALIAFPIAVLTDIWLLYYSMYKYELSEVEWKDRNICIPIMHVTPHLPQAQSPIQG